MIQYSLKCSKGHRFDSWFQSADAFDKLQAAGHVACAICGSAEVEKALMAPRVGGSDPEPAPLTQPQNPAEQALTALREQVEANSDYVGTSFATEARAMHLGDIPERPIWGEAKGAEAKALIDEGVPVMPLPFTPTRKSN